MISVDEARKKILYGTEPCGTEKASLNELTGRVAAEDICAHLTQPPFPASAMDGYAVRFEDMAKGANLRVIGEAPAGTPFQGTVRSGEAVRIFTGGAVPEEADHIIIQENVNRHGNTITINEVQSEPRHIRPAGIDFSEGDILVREGDSLHELHGSVLSAANIVNVKVFKKPVVAIFSNGDELVEPGTTLAIGEIINSNHYALSAMIRSWGGEPRYLGCAHDSQSDIEQFMKNASEADIILPVGGASVGDYDYVKSAFDAVGGELIFSNVAVRPGKPTWFGSIGGSRIVGLPGNPASAIVTAALFVQPLVKKLAGLAGNEPQDPTALLAEDILANGPREHYMRAVTGIGEDGSVTVAPWNNQDSSLLLPFTTANALIRRMPNAPAKYVGERTEIVWLRQ